MSTNDDNTTMTPSFTKPKPVSRPRLANLPIQRQRQKEEEKEEKEDIEIQLDKGQTHHVQQEILIVITAAILLNILYIPKWQSIDWLIILYSWFGWADRWTLVYARYTTFLLLLTHNTSWLYKLMPFTSALLFYIAERILNAAHLDLEHQTRQHESNVHEAIRDYGQKREAFLAVTSQEIKDTAVMIMSTLEQFSPPSILSNTYELLSACSIAVPITTISAINTTIKQACHIGSHLKALSNMISEHTKNESVETTVNEPFDVGELVQNVGDALAGMSAKLGVHFVIYHMDNGLHYSTIIGDEDATRHTLVHLLRNMLEGCTPGACIEFGLNVVSIPDTPKVRVTFDITQIVSPAIPSGIASSVPLLPNANFTEQLIRYIGGKLTIQDTDHNKVRIQLTLDAFPGTVNGDQRLILIEKPSQILEKQLQNIRFSNEPTLQDLTKFLSNLKGVRLVLHAPEKSVFARHLTSYLTHWNTDISHVPVTQVTTPATMQGVNEPITSPTQRSSNNKIPSPAIEEDHIHSIPPAFILIDDDVLILEHKLKECHDPLPAQRIRPRKPKPRANDMLFHGTTIAIIYFTSLSNYKRVRDTIQWFSATTHSPHIPRVVVVPKPAGPRRFLTALHTAWINAIVEPHFIPIATSPLSPFVAPHTALSPGIQTDGSSSTGSFVTPGGFMTPHERLSPGRNKLRLHSPNYIDHLDKGNYFTPRGSGNKERENTSPLGQVVISPKEPQQQQHHQPQEQQEQQQIKKRIRSISNARLGLLENTQLPSKENTDVQQEQREEQTKEETKRKPKINFNISNRKRKEKNAVVRTSPPITVLIVEDNMINQAILSTWMKKHGIKFSVASDGKEAVEKWRGGGFHLILMDIQLPIMDGIQATKMIRGIEKDQKTGVLPSMNTEFQSPVIIVALTASSLESDRQAALAAGCNDFLTKPVSLEWLEKKITEWGCMQALIDVEGWKKWRKNKKLDDVTTTHTTEDKEKKEQTFQERTKELHKDTSKAILLLGISKSEQQQTLRQQLETRKKLSCHIEQ